MLFSTRRLISGIGNIYADETLWRARMHGQKPTRTTTAPEALAILGHARDVLTESLAAGGTSFDALYVSTEGVSGLFERSLHVYGREGQPCDRCGAPIRRGPVHEPLLLHVPVLSAPAAAVPRVTPASRVTVFVHGSVQGVGFRWWIRSRALELGLVGTATNLPDGRVQVVAEGAPEQLTALVALLQPGYAGARPGSVDAAVEQWAAARGTLTGFRER